MLKCAYASAIWCNMAAEIFIWNSHNYSRRFHCALAVVIAMYKAFQPLQKHCNHENMCTVLQYCAICQVC